MATTIAAYGAANALGGSGFIAAFVAGALFGLLADAEVANTMQFTEVTGSMLDSVTFLVFGALLLGPAFKHLSWQIVLYAVLSLTVVRMVPVAIALFGTHARPATVAFIGWFGPRGLASIVFAVISRRCSAPALCGHCFGHLFHGWFFGASFTDFRRFPRFSFFKWFQAVSDENPPSMETQPAHEHRPRL